MPQTLCITSPSDQTVVLLLSCKTTIKTAWLFMSHMMFMKISEQLSNCSFKLVCVDLASCITASLTYVLMMHQTFFRLRWVCLRKLSSLQYSHQIPFREETGLVEPKFSHLKTPKHSMRTLRTSTYITSNQNSRQTGASHALNHMWDLSNSDIAEFPFPESYLLGSPIASKILGHQIYLNYVVYI